MSALEIQLKIYLDKGALLYCEAFRSFVSQMSCFSQLEQLSLSLVNRISFDRLKIEMFDFSNLSLLKELRLDLKSHAALNFVGSKNNPVMVTGFPKSLELLSLALVGNFNYSLEEVKDLPRLRIFHSNLYDHILHSNMLNPNVEQLGLRCMHRTLNLPATDKLQIL